MTLESLIAELETIAREIEARMGRSDEGTRSPAHEALCSVLVELHAVAESHDPEVRQRAIARARAAAATARLFVGKACAAAQHARLQRQRSRRIREEAVAMRERILREKEKVG